MKALHIVQGGTGNGDKAWLERAATRKLNSSEWVVPKSAMPGDDVVIYIANYGFFATAIIKSVPRPRLDWHNRYGASLTSIRLIEPPISLGLIRKQIPELTWANYPRSITTPTLDVANEVRELISLRRKKGVADLKETDLTDANLDELRKIALQKARPTATVKEQKTLYRVRAQAIKLYVIRRSNGICEGCRMPAPFSKPDGSPYLEPHHTLRLADDGPDHPRHVIALCPNCHRRTHYSADAKSFNKRLMQILSRLESR